jgi:hypothetical protein
MDSPQSLREILGSISDSDEVLRTLTIEIRSDLRRKKGSTEFEWVGDGKLRIKCSKADCETFKNEQVELQDVGINVVLR